MPYRRINVVFGLKSWLEIYTEYVNQNYIQGLSDIMTITL